MPLKPSWQFERKAHRAGFERVAGIDEAGRGPLAGPVVAAAVVFAPGFRMAGLADSKQLSPERRAELAQDIRASALAVGVGAASAEEIDRTDILSATCQAGLRAIQSLGLSPDYLLTDYLRLAWADAPVVPLVKGDQRCASVAAASIIAKVARDQWMRAYDEEYPGYGFAAHKGYGTPAHLDALRALGPTTIHRLTFRGVCWFETELRRSKTFDHLAEAIATADGEQVVRLVQPMIVGAAHRLPRRELDEIEALYSSRLKEWGIQVCCGRGL
jgi:ribonuclease HII